METEVGKLMTITVIQKRPNTCVAIATVDETQYVGFSKVCWPDTWDSRTGLHVALGKAAADMFQIKVPKSGRMDVHLLPDPRPGVKTKGERELEEIRNEWNGLVDLDLGKLGIVDSDGPYIPFEEKIPCEPVDPGDGGTTVTAAVIGEMVGDGCISSRTEHLPDHRTMEERQDDERHYARKRNAIKKTYVRVKAAEKEIYTINARRKELLEEIESAFAVREKLEKLDG